MVGRYSNIDKINRVCMLCDMGDKGDSFHYLFNCSFFHKDREKFIKNYIDNSRLSSASTKIKILMSSSDPVQLTNLSRFVTIVMNHFSSDKVSG